MNPARVLGALLLAATFALVAGCAGSGASRKPSSGPTAGKPGGTATASRSARGGGYYLDDGPGSGAPDPFSIPDAVPRAEPIAPRSTRPYVALGRQFVPMTERLPYREQGTASWYGRRYHGNPTSIGEPYDMYAMTAAHPTLPLPSYVRVRHLGNGRSVTVRVNDRGPFLHDRIIDLSWTAAAKLGFVNQGSAAVEVELITSFDPPGASPLVDLPGASRPQPLAAPGQTTAASDPPVARASMPRMPADSAAPAPSPSPSPSPSTPASVDATPIVAMSAADPAAPASDTAFPLLERAWWLQFGAFAAKETANSVRERLRGQMEQALGAALDVFPDEALFRVQAGPWATREAAAAAALRARAAGFEGTPYVVQR